MPVTTPILAEQFLFGIKSETTYGTARTLTASVDFMYVNKTDVKFESQDIARDYKHADLNALESAQGPVLISFNVEGEYMVSGSAGDVVGPMDAIEKASGMGSVVSAATSVTYSGSNAAAGSFPGPGTSATALLYYKGELVTVRGVYGDYEETHESNGVVTFKFSGKGLYTAMSTTTQPSATIPTASYVRVSSSSLSVHSYIPEWSKFTVKYGNTVEAIPYAGDANGYSKVVITKRRPTFEFDPLMPGTGTHDYIARLVAKSKGALSLVVGTATGAKITYTAADTQYTSVDVAERSSLQSFNVVGKIIGNFTKLIS